MNIFLFNHWAAISDVKTCLSSNHCTLYTRCLRACAYWQQCINNNGLCTTKKCVHTSQKQQISYVQQNNSTANKKPAIHMGLQFT